MPLLPKSSCQNLAHSQKGQKVYVNVALNFPVNNGLFCYKISKEYQDLLGRRVWVSFRNKRVLGVIAQVLPADFTPDYTVLDIKELVDDEPTVTFEQAQLISFCSEYYFNSLGMVYHLALIKNTVMKTRTRVANSSVKPYFHELTLKQKEVVTSILNGTKKNFLLQGVTGSGKTLVYLNVAKEVLQKGQSVLFLVPEISLTPHLVKRVEGFLGEEVAVFHSGITAAKKRNEYLALLSKEKRVLIGARSSIFSPLPNLGLIVVDEEHDQSFKQDEAPRYNARDLALWRSYNEKAICILGSATPSLESIQNGLLGKITHLKLKERANNWALPKVRIIDLKERKEDIDNFTQDKSLTGGQNLCIISKPLRDKINENLQQKRQTLIFLNQRGYAKFGVCKTCGELLSCPNCSVSLTYYEKRKVLLCHQCDHFEEVSYTCKNCQKEEIIFLGLGTERLDSEVKKLFPQARVIRIDRDIIKTSSQLKTNLDEMYEKKADILIGTQMIAKGHDFDNVFLVGVVFADGMLSLPDFRASEKAFCLLTQVLGRAGRKSHDGVGIIQTFNEHHPSIKYAKNHDVDGFIEQEMQTRKKYEFPPFTKASIIRLEHKNEALVQKVINHIFILVTDRPQVCVYGPSECLIKKIQDRYRYQLMILSPNQASMHRTLKIISQDAKLKAFVAKQKMRFILDRDAFTVY